MLTIDYSLIGKNCFREETVLDGDGNPRICGYYYPKTIEAERRMKFGKNAYVIELNSMDKEIISKHTEYSWCRNEKKIDSTSYANGIGNKDSSDKTIENAGCAGEIALSKIIGFPMFYGYKKNGDNSQDFYIDPYKIDIKTASKKRNCKNFIRAYYNGVEFSLKSDIYIGAYIGDEEEVTVYILGFLFKNEIDTEKKPSPKWGQNHLNYEVPFVLYKPLEYIVDLSRAKI